MKLSQTSNLTQNILALCILLVIIFIGIWLNPQGPNGVHGIFLPNQNYTPAQNSQNINSIDASKIQILNLYPQGQESRNMGIINASAHWDVLSDQSNQMLFQASLNYAKYLAAQAGASAIYVMSARAEGAPGSPLNSFATQFIVLK